jgi:hypothetical protein
MIATAPSGILDRLFDLYRRTASSRTALTLVAANAIPLIGVAFFGWSLWTLLVLYWVENGIVGFWTVPRILFAQGALVSPDLLRERRVAPDARAAIDRFSSSFGALPRVFMTVFFLFHYGIFWIGHGFFVFLIPRFLGAVPAADPGIPVVGTPGTFEATGGLGSVAGQSFSGPSAFGEIVWSAVALGAVAMFLSHGWSFLANYVGRGEFRTTSASTAMSAPYGRVVVLHLTIIFGAILIAELGAPIGALLVLVAGKTILDLSLHLRDHPAAPS